jgi:hypothetical protein
MYIVNWDFLIEHPGRNFACCKKMKKQKIPMLYYRDELPDLEDCDIGVPEEELSESAKQSREAYATTMLLLFYPFRDTHVFDDAPNKWDFFCKAVDGKTEMKMYFDANRIMQNIQNLHNSKKFVRPKDKLILETELTRLQKEFCNGVEEQQVASNNEQMEGEESDTNDDTDLIIEEYAYFRNELEQVDSNRICSAASKNFDPKHLSSKDNIDTCGVLKESDFVPEGLTDIDTSKTVLRSNSFTKENFIQVILDFDKPCTPAECDRNWTFDQINPSDKDNPNKFIDRLDGCALKFDLDIYQKAAFNVICSSFMLRYLEKSKSSHLPNYEEAKSKLIARGAEKQLIMFLSGAGGCGKSHVIGVAKQMCHHFCRSINEGFDFSSFLVTASTNSAAAIIGGQTIHSVAQLRTKFHNVTINGKDVTIHWVTANLIIIDEISMLSLDDFDKLDKHLRQLMREATKADPAPFGGLNIVLCGDFFQLNPVLAVPIYNRKRNVLWHLINSVIFCKGFNHRFKDDPEWGDLLDRLRLGLLTEDDYDFLDKRVIGKDLALPVTEPSDDNFLSYVCPTNAQRNRITDNNFEDLVQRTHPLAASNLAAPDYTVIIKGIFRGKKGASEKSEQFHRLIYNNCGDDNVIMAGGSGRVDPCLKLNYGSPIMVSEFKDVKMGVVKGVTGKFVGLVLKKDCRLQEEIWGGYKINTIRADEVDHIICERVKDKPMERTRHFVLKPKKFTVSAKIPVSGGNHLTLSELQIFQLPMNLDEATTGHKLQGKTKSLLGVVDHNYGENWIYVAYSRVKKSSGLFLFKKLNRNKKIGPTTALLREIEALEEIERKTLGRLQKTGIFPSDIDLSIGVTSTVGNAKKSKSTSLRRTVPTYSATSSIDLGNSFNIDACLSGINMKRLTATYFHFSVGNCLFDSISYLADEWNGNGKGLRASAIAWAKSEYSIGISDWCSRIKSHFSDTLIDEDLYGMMTYLDYLTKLEDPAVYATSIDIFMISNFLKANIVIYSNSEHPNREFCGLFGQTLYLYYNSVSLHYEPIVPL